jgi:hypothetical protein
VPKSGQLSATLMTAAWAVDYPSSEPRSVAVSGESFRHLGVYRRSTTWVKARDGSATSSWTGTVRQRFGDSRGHWERNTIVVDVTNFGQKTDFLGSRENLHLVERFTRMEPSTLDMKSRLKIQPYGRGRGRRGKSSPSRTTRKTEFITSLAASKEIMAFPGCYMNDAWKSARLRSKEVPIRQPETSVRDAVIIERDPLTRIR